MEQVYEVIFKTTGLDRMGRELKELTERALGQELIRVYNIYANRTNSGITEQLNNEFHTMYPNYKYSKNIWENTLYCQFMADGYNRLVVDELNKQNISKFMNFYVNPEEVQFMGSMKDYPNVTIEFFMKPVEA